MQGLLIHLAGAVENRASFEDVRPAWEDFLRSLWNLINANSADDGTVLWIARTVFHRIAGEPLGAVARCLHQSAWQLADTDATEK